MNFSANSAQRRRISAGSRPAASLTTLNSMGRPWQSQPGMKGAVKPAIVLRFDHQVLEQLVERGAHVDVAVGEGRAVVQDELRAPLARGGGRGFSGKDRRFPSARGASVRSPRVAAHRKVVCGRSQRVFVIRGVGAHDGARTLASAPPGVNGHSVRSGGSLILEPRQNKGHWPRRRAAASRCIASGVREGGRSGDG